MQPGAGDIEAMAEDRPYGGDGGSGGNVDYAVDTRYGGSARHADRLLVQAVHADHRAQAGCAIRFHRGRTWQCHRHRLHQLPGRPGWLRRDSPRLPGDERGRTAVRVRPIDLHGHRSVGQRVLRDLEKKVGLCNVVKTAGGDGVHRADGTSLLEERWPGARRPTTSRPLPSARSTCHHCAWRPPTRPWPRAASTAARSRLPRSADGDRAARCRCPRPTVIG